MKNNKYKTDWELLPEIYRELVPKNGIYHMKNGIDLILAFGWSRNEMGADFWLAIDDELDYIKSCS